MEQLNRGDMFIIPHNVRTTSPNISQENFDLARGVACVVIKKDNERCYWALTPRGVGLFHEEWIKNYVKRVFKEK